MFLRYAKRRFLRAINEAWPFLRETVRSFLDDNAMRMAAALAFYMTFSITPALLIGLSIAGLVIGNTRAESELTARIGQIINPQAASYVFTLVEGLSAELQGKHLPLIGILGAVVAATAVFVELHSSLNAIWGESLTKRQSHLRIIRSRAISFVFVVGIGILLMVSVVTSTVLTAINSLLLKTLPLLQEVVHWLQILVQFGILPLLLALTYKLVPDTFIEWKDVVPGALITAVLFLLGKWAFGMYLRVSVMTSVYGAAASLFILLVWVYYSAQVFFLGAEMTKVYARNYGSRSKERQERLPL